MTEVAGVDISGVTAHVVVLNDAGAVVGAEPSPTQDLVALAADLSTCSVVAIDSPDRWSSGRIAEHAGVSPKFQAARCAEVGLALQAGFWVPWVTPMRPQADDEWARYAWMARGIELFELLRKGPTEAIEVFPNAVFRRLAGGKALAKKSSLDGVRARAELLDAEDVSAPFVTMWSHDALDAAAAALVALRRHQSLAESVTCGHDGSAMWLPSPGQRADGP